MKKLHIVWLTLVAVFALGALAASPAFAVNEWLVGGLTVSEVNSAGTTVSAEGTLLLEDMEAILIPTTKPASMICLGLMLGLILPAGKGTVNSISKITCENEQNCSSPSASPVNLEWNTLLEMSTTRDTLTAHSGGGNPGWLAVCSGLVNDTCTASKGFVLVTNETNGTVDLEFMENEQETATCTLNNTVSGLVVGLLILEELNPTGTLQVS